MSLKALANVGLSPVPLSSKRPPPIHTPEVKETPDLSLRPTASQLTPPVTPLNAKNPARAIATRSAGCLALEGDSLSSDPNPLIYQGSFEVEQSLGRGCWSVVYAAKETSLCSLHAPSMNQLPSPPSSPLTLHSSRVLAVKTPLSTFSEAILYREAQVLTHLMQSPKSKPYIIPFHGLHLPSKSLVLGMAPQTLADYATSALRHPSSLESSDPIIGTRTWLHLALHLIHGLAFVHEEGVIHGDIKPSNILLRANTPSSLLSSSSSSPQTLTPLYIDFSSSTLPSLPPPPPSTDAVTPEYASPELLGTYAKGGTPTPVSDIWALAVTLLAAATGEEPYAATASRMQRLEMIKQGWALEAARGGAQGGRVRAGGVVARALKGVLVRRVEQRWGVGEWGEVVAGVAAEFGVKG